MKVDGICCEKFSHWLTEGRNYGAMMIIFQHETIVIWGDCKVSTIFCSSSSSSGCHVVTWKPHLSSPLLDHTSSSTLAKNKLSYKNINLRPRFHAKSGFITVFYCSDFPFNAESGFCFHFFLSRSSLTGIIGTMNFFPSESSTEEKKFVKIFLATWKRTKKKDEGSTFIGNSKGI